MTIEDEFMREAMQDITDYDIDMLISITEDEWMKILGEDNGDI